MSMSAEQLQEIRQLADAVADLSATDQETQRLSELLKDAPELQDAYLDYLDVHALLCWEFRGSNTQPASPADVSTEQPTVVERRSRMRWTLTISTVVAVLLAIGAMLSHYLKDPQRADVATFCQLTQAAGARWDSEIRPEIGDRLAARRLKLDSGIGELTFDNGVKAVLAGPVELELIDDMRAYLHQGRVVFHVPPPAIGFICETAEAKVMDLGTEFGVRASDDVGTELQVYEGEVVAKPTGDDSGHGQRLQGGQAVRFGRGPGAALEELSFWPDRFVRYLPDPNDPNAPRKQGKRKVSPYNKSQHDEIRIVPAPPQVTIDGSLDEWDQSGKFVSRCEPPYDSFYHVRGMAMYDEHHLYIGAEVGDPFPMRSTVSPHEDRNLYGNGGCLAFRISTDRQLGWPARGRGIGTSSVRKLIAEDYNEKLVFLVLWFYQPEGIPCLHVKYGMDQHGRLVNPPGYQGAFRKHADGWGYTAEYAIPWSLLNAEEDPPRAGDTLGFTWLVHWAGPEGRNWKGQLIDILNPDETEWNFQDAATWGRAIYSTPKDIKP